MFDFFLWNPQIINWKLRKDDLDDRELLLECQRPYLLDIMVHLHAYKARSRVTITDVSEEWNVVAAEEPTDLFQNRMQSIDDNILAIRDNRSPKWSLSRYLLRTRQNESNAFFSDLQPASRREYRLQRMIHGVPEGFVEIKSGHAIPFDFNLDLMGGIETNIGCYTGQELVTRTLHQGLIRKRLHPVRLYHPDTEWVGNAEEDFAVDGDKTMHLINETELMGATIIGKIGNITDYTANYSVKMGRIVRTIGNVGLAIIREEHLSSEKRNFAAALSDRPDMVLCEIK